MMKVADRSEILSVNPASLTRAAMNYIEIPRRRTGIVGKAMNPQRATVPGYAVILFGTGSYNAAANAALLTLRLFIAAVLACATLLYIHPGFAAATAITGTALIAAGFLTRPASMLCAVTAIIFLRYGSGAEITTAAAVVASCAATMIAGSGSLGADKPVYSAIRRQASKHRSNALSTYKAFSHI